MSDAETTPRRTRLEYLKERKGPRQFVRSHPGEMLKEDFLDPMGITQAQLAADLGIPTNRVNEIVKGKRGITPETAFLLADYFDMPVEFWAGIQMEYDLDLAEMTIMSKLQRVQVHAKDRQKKSA